MNRGVVALVPARSGSKGVPDKNVRLLGDRPLLAWSVAAALRSSRIERVIVSTDSAHYADVAKRCGAEAPFLRPPELATDEAADIGMVSHTLDWLAERNEEPDILVHLRPTTPFRSPGLIDKSIDLFTNHGEATALRSVHKMSTTAYKSMEITDEGILRQLGSDRTELDPANAPRQAFPVTYLANGYVDVLGTSFIRTTGLLHGDHVIPFLTPLAPEVDTEDDFEFLVHYLERHPEVADLLFG